MAALKAIRINKDNKQRLEGQYSMSEDFLEYSSGLYLVAEFGSMHYKGILTKAGLESSYTKVKDLDNGFFEIERKPAEPIAAGMTL